LLWDDCNKNLISVLFFSEISVHTRKSKAENIQWIISNFATHVKRHHMKLAPVVGQQPKINNIFPSKNSNKNSKRPKVNKGTVIISETVSTDSDEVLNDTAGN
jgi:hypothetical protein